MFKIGEYVMYKRDLCIIKDIFKLKNKKYYKLSPVEDKSLIINVPCSNNYHYLRYPITKKEAEEIINKMPDIETIDINNQLLELTYINLLKTNTHEDLIKIIKTTYSRNELRRKNGKKEADKDLTYFEKAEKYLYNELGYALGMSYKECKNYIISKLSDI